MQSATIFHLTQGHVKLIREMNIYWDDDAYEGAPAVNIKRPYGNSDVVGDVADILGISKIELDEGESGYPIGTADRCRVLHRQMDTALQVVLSAGTFEPGTYECEKYKGNWKRVNGT